MSKQRNIKVHEGASCENCKNEIFASDEAPSPMELEQESFYVKSVEFCYTFEK